MGIASHPRSTPIRGVATMVSDAAPRATIIKHSVSIAGHRTSISLEALFWDRLQVIAAARDRSVAALVCEVDAERGAANLSSALRVFVLAQSLGSAIT